MKTETITCQQCGTNFEWESETSPGDFMHGAFKPTQCNTCSEAFWRQREQALDEERKARVESIVENVLWNQDKVFQRTDTANPGFNLKAWNKIKSWRPSSEKPWLGMIGLTGTSKSRIAHLLVLELIREMTTGLRSAELAGWNAEVIFTTSYEITDAVMAQFAGDDEKRRARDFLAKLRRSRILLIDDVGKGRLSPAVASELFAILDTRSRDMRTTIWTANSTPERIAQSLPAELQDDMAGPLAGRLNDFSKIFNL